MQLLNQFLRMADLANQPFKPEKIVTDSTGKKRIIPAKPAQRGIIGFSSKHIYHLINCNKFPSPVKVGKASLWRLSDINEWIAKQGAENEN